MFCFMIQTPKSSYVGVSWSTSSQKWLARMNHNYISYNCGLHVHEIDAASAINKKCRELGIEERNPGIQYFKV